MGVDAFLKSITESGARLTVPPIDVSKGRAPEAVDALFHLPLLALATMVIARRNPLHTTVLGRSIGLLLVAHFTALHRSASVLEMSVTLRRRCADSLAFLEAAALVSVSESQSQRLVSLTPEGKKHIDRASRDAGDLGLLVRRLRSSHARMIARSGDGR